jgi:phosphoribosylpyrophosphate synthetase
LTISPPPPALLLNYYAFRRFADGFPNLYVRDAIRIRNRHVAFLASFDDPSVIFEQISIIYQLPRLFVGSFTLVLPYFPTGTAERVEAEGDVATAFTLARIISNIPLARGGPASVVIFDIHALQERFYFGDQVLPLFESGIPLLRERLRQLSDSDNVTIAYPDEGAWKRFHYQFGDYPEVICTKVRDGQKRIVRLKEGSARDRHVIIVDDLVQSGGTLIECQKLLATQGAAHVSAYVTHGVFPNESWKRFVPEGENGASDGFKYFWITDSCPKTVDAVTDRQPFEVLSLAEPIAAALQI